MRDSETGQDIAVMTAPYDDQFEMPTRRYMVVAEMETRYGSIYEALDEHDDEDLAVEMARKSYEQGGRLAPIEQLPQDVRNRIWVFLDMGYFQSRDDLPAVVKHIT